MLCHYRMGSSASTSALGQQGAGGQGAYGGENAIVTPLVMSVRAGAQGAYPRCAPPASANSIFPADASTAFRRTATRCPRRNTRPVS